MCTHIVSGGDMNTMQLGHFRNLFEKCVKKPEECQCCDQQCVLTSSLFTWDLICVVFFHTDQPANISGFELQGRSSTNQYVTKFTMGYKSHANQNGPQDYPNAQSTKVPESRRTSSQDIIRLIKQQKGNVGWRLEEDAWNSLDPVLIWPYLGVCFACSVVKWRSCSLVK